MKRKRNISVNKIRLALVTIVAVQFPNMLCLLSSQIADVIGDANEMGVPQSFKDLNFTNITAIDAIARKAMTTLHNDLDHDDDGNVSITEGATFIHREEFKGKSGSSNLPGFATDKDGRITEAEFWDAWATSTVHNWTAAQMVEWISVDVELPQYAFKFKQYAIPGAAMPIFTDVPLLKSFILTKGHRQKVKIRATELVLFGPPSKSSLMKDVLVSVSLILALGGIAFGIHVHRNAKYTVMLMQSKMNNLQRELTKIEEEDEGVWMKDLEATDSHSTRRLRKDSDRTESNASLISDGSEQHRLSEVLEELADVKQALEHAEERLKLNDKHWAPPSRLMSYLQTTYQVETKLHEVKRHVAHKKVEQAKAQFQKMKKKASIFSSVQFIHSRQVDSFDLEVQAAKDALREIQRDSHEYRKRWMELESLLRCKISSQSTTTRHVTTGTKLLDEARRMSRATEISESGVSSTASADLDMNSNVTTSSNGSSFEDLASVASSKDTAVAAAPPHGKLTHKKQQESCPSLGEFNREQKAKHPSETVPRTRRPVSIHCVSNNEQKPHDNRNRSASMVNMKTSSRHVTGVTPIEEEVSPASSVTSKSTLVDDGFHTLPKKRKSPMFLRKNDSVRSGPSPEVSTRPTSTSLTPRLGSNGNPQVRKAESTHSLPDLKSGSQASQNNNSTNGDFDAKPNKPKRTIGNIFKRKKKSEKT